MIKVKSLNHAGLSVKDFEKARHFYEKVLGLKTLPRPAFGVAGEWYMCAENQIHVIESKDGNHQFDMPHGLNATRKHLAIVVEDLDEVKRVLEEEKVTYDYFEEKFGDVVIRAIFTLDPDGNMFEMRTSYPGPKPA